MTANDVKQNTLIDALGHCLAFFNVLEQPGKTGKEVATTSLVRREFKYKFDLQITLKDTYKLYSCRMAPHTGVVYCHLR